MDRQAKFNYLMSQAITFPAIADELRSKAAAPELEAFVSFGMQVRDDQRRHVSEVLGVPVIELYGSEECGAMAQQCPAHDVLHVMSELVYGRDPRRRRQSPVPARA